MKKIGRTTISDKIDITGLTPEEVNRIIVDVNRSKAISDKFSTTIDGGLISTVQIELREADTENVTAGTSGIQTDQSGFLPFGYMPAYWSGGTYEQAVNFGTVFKAMEDGEPIPNLEMANIVHLHCGASRQGDLVIDKNGNIRTLSKKFEIVNGKIKVENAEIKGNVSAGTVGGWSITPKGISSKAGGATISVEENGGRFIHINRNPETSMVNIRSDDSTGIDVYTHGSRGVGVSVLAQTGATAIKSTGSHDFYQRAGEVWSAPGILACIQINLSNSGYIYSFDQKWAIGPLKNIYVYRNGRTIRVHHGIGHQDYVVQAAINAGNAVVDINTAEKGNSSCLLNIAGNYSNAHRVVVTLIGRNKL